jgi:CRISPR/Cas system type I-B associated protein Csh2 (Cas7 group RAMP superfamily)
MGIRMKYFPNGTGLNNEQAAAMNAALVSELENDIKPTEMITAKNRVYEFFIQKAKLKNLNAVTCMGSLGLNPTKSVQFFNGEHKHVEFLKLLHAVTMIGYDVKISLIVSDFPFGKISIDS